ncbi:MAG: hypothetical protein KKD18_03650 [Nanoarchaeota archaeon]|nr:hypothetical protein [Nanoarchaeota archaeon]MBU0977485.1 hypothetical protein [Nanoarchaeota archaeon]
MSSQSNSNWRARFIPEERTTQGELSGGIWYFEGPARLIPTVIELDIKISDYRPDSKRAMDKRRGLFYGVVDERGDLV